MFQKVTATKFPPPKPLMVWDGKCSFCAYWISYWQKISGEAIAFESYETAAARFPDLDLSLFKQASRLIDRDGRIYSGPDSAYYSFKLRAKYSFLHTWYQKYSPFRAFSDWQYQIIASNRNIFFRITKFLFGSDPENIRPFWAVYLFVLIFLYLI